MVVASEKVPLQLVSDEVYQLGRSPERTSERIRRLQFEARMLAREQIEGLEKGMSALAAQASEIAAGGEAYPAGVRDLAERLTEDLQNRLMTMQALMARVPEPRL